MTPDVTPVFWLPYTAYEPSEAPLDGRHRPVSREATIFPLRLLHKVPTSYAFSLHLDQLVRSDSPAMVSPDSAIPVVDFARWAAGSAEERTRLARELTGACREVGFVYVVGHGVPADLVDRAFAWSKALFALPEETKRRAPHPPGPHVHRGYSWPGLEKVSQYVHRDGDDADAAEEALRAVADYKVRDGRSCFRVPLLHPPAPARMAPDRRSRARSRSRSAARSSRCSQTSGCPRTCCRASAGS